MMEYTEIKVNKVIPLKVGIGLSNTSFGELLQGGLPHENQFKHLLVTFPVDLQVKAIVEIQTNTSEVQIEPKMKSKSALFAQKLLHRLVPQCGAKIRLESKIKEGRGLSSSTSDLVAVARAIEDALGMTVTSELICDICREIEPTDGLMYDGCVAFFHRDVKLHSKLGTLPKFVLLAVDEGKLVDTIAYNMRQPQRSIEEAFEYLRLFDMLRDAIERRDTAAIGKISTASARMNQKYNKLEGLEDYIGISDKLEAEGVLVTHSGSMCAVLFALDDPMHEIKLQQGLDMLKAIGKEASIIYSI